LRLGIFGGTFDPPHVGHLIVAQDAREQLALDRVIFVPAAQPPHKIGREISGAELRLEMLQRAVALDPAFYVDDLELRRPGPSYTVDTLRELRRRQPDAELFLLLGADQFAEIRTWREAEMLPALARIAVLTRAGESGTASRPAGTDTPDDTAPIDAITVAVTRIDLSASDVRRRVAEGRSIRHLVPREVAQSIHRNGLYRADQRTGAGTPG
jgi:nicotinate-nucleotide adenylyltransferase